VIKLQVNNKRVLWEDGHLDLNLPVLEAIRLDERILVIYDYMAYRRGNAARNLVAYNTNGERLWAAEAVGQCAETDAYVDFMSEKPLIVWNYSCCRCTIDPNTGKLLASEFTK